MYFLTTSDKMMSLQVGCLIVCLLVTFVCHSQGLYVSMVRTPDDVYCGHLQCSIDINQTDSHILFIIGLTIFDVILDTSPVKVAALSAYAPDPLVEPTKIKSINATGSVSRYHADLTLSFLTETDCLQGSFLCELDFVNVSGQPDIITEVVTPESNGYCPTIMNQLLETVGQIKTYSDVTDSKLTAMKTEIETLFQGQLTELRTDVETLFNNVLGQLSRLEKVLNSSLITVPVDTDQITCERRMPISHPRQKFLLWGHIEALCDTETDRGDWIVIQRRTKGDVDFYRGWNDYKNGFGTPDTDFWIGNEVIHNLTSQGYTELRVDLEFQGSPTFAHYTNVILGDEMSNYQLTVGGFGGTDKDALLEHNGMSFTTYDRDNDPALRNYAEVYHGAWWYYYGGYYSNLNGLWAAENSSGVVWMVSLRSASFTEMKIRHV